VIGSKALRLRQLDLARRMREFAVEIGDDILAQHAADSMELAGATLCSVCRKELGAKKATPPDPTMPV